MRSRLLTFTLAVILLAASASSAQQLKTRGNKAYGNLPLTFELNEGQSYPQVRFLSRSQGYTAFLTTGGMTLSLRTRGVAAIAVAGDLPAAPSSSQPTSATLQFALVGAVANPVVVGEDPQPGRVNYFMGNDPAKWHTNVPTYAKVRYKNVYPGIDLVYYGSNRQLEYDFEIQPGADPNKIQFAIQGARQIDLDAEGNLVLTTANGELHFQSPSVYQESNGRKTAVSGGYVVKDPTHIGFQIAHYDSSQSLVIDPVLVYSTYLGGSGTDQPYGIAVDSSGSVYVAGCTDSANFPLATLGSLPGNTYHVFVAKLDASGSNLVYADYIGGNSQDCGIALVLDNAKNVYVTGATQSSNFPIVKPYQAQQPGPYSGFLTRVSADGSSLLYSTYLGGNTLDQPTSVAIDGLGQVHVAGYTQSQNFPVANAYQATVSANQGGIYGDYGFLTKFSPDGSSLVYSTYFSGNSNVVQDCGVPCWPSPYNVVNAVAVDANGNAYLSGVTNTYNFPSTAGAYSTTNSTQQDATIGFVSKFSSVGSLAYSTYFFGSSGAPVWISAIAVDGSGSAYVTGTGQSDGTFPITSTSICDPGTYGFGCSYAFVTRFDPTGSSLLYSTFLGPNNYASPQAIALDGSDNAYVLATALSGLLQTNNAIELYTSKSDLLLVEIDPAATTQLFSTYLGGSGNDSPAGVALDLAGNIYVAGSSNSTDFPVTPAAFQGIPGGNTDAVLVKIGPGSAPGVILNPSDLQFASESVGSTSPAQSVVVRNMGSATLSIASIVASGDFAESDTCGGSVLAAGSCTVSVTFTPTAAGSRSGSVMISDNAAGSPHAISLLGVGSAVVASLSPASLTFSNTQVGTSSAAQTVTLSTVGALPLGIIQSTGPFSQTNNCPGLLPSGASCQFQITFTPVSTGASTGALTLTNIASDSPETVALTGNGYASGVTVAPGSLAFSGQALGSSSTVQMVTVTNPSGSALTISSVTVTGDFSQTNNCGTVAANGGTCTVGVKFSPTVSGQRSGTLTVTDNVAGPHSVGLTGTGSDFSLATSPSSAIVKAGATATYTVTVAPVGGAFSNAIQLSCSGVPTHATCSVSPTSVTPGSTSPTVKLTVNTTSSSAAAALGSQPNQPIYVAWMQLQGFGLFAMMIGSSKRWKKRGAALIALVLLIGALLFMSACAGGTGIASQGQGTAPGTYTITVSGSSGNLQHSFPVTLTVQ